jgi:hypothetical protein
MLDVNSKTSSDWLIKQLQDLAANLDLPEAKTRRIVDQIVVDMPLHTDEERLEWARIWMLAAAGYACS